MSYAGFSTPESAALFANRAACYVALKDGHLAREDALKAIELDPAYAKGYYRAAKAAILEGELEEATTYFQKVGWKG